MSLETIFMLLETLFTALEIHFTALEIHFMSLETLFTPLEIHFMPLETLFTPLETSFMLLEIHFTSLETSFNRETEKIYLVSLREVIDDEITMDTKTCGKEKRECIIKKVDRKTNYEDLLFTSYVGISIGVSEYFKVINHL